MPKKRALRRMRPLCFDRRGYEIRIGEFEIGVLRDFDEFVLEPARLANARLARVLPLEAPQHAEEIEAPRLGLKF